jgi:hypothetical protein
MARPYNSSTGWHLLPEDGPNSPRKLPNRPLPDDGILDLEVKARLAEVSDHTAEDQGRHGEADQARQGGV